MPAAAEERGEIPGGPGQVLTAGAAARCGEALLSRGRRLGRYVPPATVFFLLGAGTACAASAPAGQVYVLPQGALWEGGAAMAGLLSVAFALTLGFLYLRRTAKKLRQSESRFRTLVEGSLQGILVHRGWLPLFANQALLRMFGFDPGGAACGEQSLDPYIFPHEQEKVQRYLRERMEGGEGPETFRFQGLRRDGEPIRLEGRSVRVDWGGEPAVLTTLVDVTEQHRAEEALRQAHANLQDIINFLPDATLVIDKRKQTVAWNRAMEELTGVSREEVLGTRDYALPFYGKHRPLLIDLLDRSEQEIRRFYPQAERRGELLVAETYRVPAGKRSGAYSWLMAAPLFDRRGNIAGAIETVRDITAHRQAEQGLAAERSFLQAVIDGVTDPILVIGLDYRVLLMNQAAGEHPEQPAGGEPLYCYRLSHGLDGPCTGDRHLCPLREVRRSGQPVTLLHEHCATDGSRRTVEVKASPLWDAEGRLSGVVEASRDITERLLVEARLRENEDRLQYLVHHDALTDLPNRALFHDRLHHAMARARRSDHQLALLFMDLDRFKTINDSLGHPCGDRVLCEVARRLSGGIRESDTVARLGGDEFVILLEQVSDIPQAIQAAQKILALMATPLSAEGQELFLSASLGIGLFPADSEDAEGLMKCADAAMYRAKEVGGNTYQFYTPDLNARARDLLTLETSLRRAMDQQELIVHYQPQLDFATGRFIGAEALVRWQHPRRGMVPPGDFIPLAEENGLIVPIGEFVLRTACAQARAWQQAGTPLRVGVNISPRQFRQADLPAMVAGVLAEAGLEPRLLELEITESLIMRDVQAAVATMQELSRMGVQLAIDDFGSGYSSLSYLQSFPLSRLKIDRSFVRDVSEGRREQAITASIVALAHNLEMEVIAEGVETDAQFHFLQRIGCDQGQGYLFARPLPAGEISALLQEVSGGLALGS